uniref:Death associated protein n=1 Tax=Equus asinus TaxID=9793 RepID=A0A9L0JLV0_EQUAS
MIDNSHLCMEFLLSGWNFARFWRRQENISQSSGTGGDAESSLSSSTFLWSPPKPTVFISGVIARGDKDFPPAAAQVAHQKPHASIDKHTSPRTQHIQQPRK